MKYYVRSIEGKCWMSNQYGIVAYETVKDAKENGVFGGISFEVVESELLQRTVVFGIKAAGGFFFLGGTLQNRDTSREPTVAGTSPVKADQKHIRPLV